MQNDNHASPIIKILNLHKIYRVGDEQIVALKNINLNFIKGEICCIVGPSGSGKSTLLNMLAGLEKPTHGEIIISNRNLSVMTEDQLAIFRQENLGFIFQSYNLLPQYTAVENVALPLVFRGVEKHKRNLMAKRQLDAVGLLDRIHHKPSEMSGGQQQRVGIARAFINKPAVIFADEPTGNLDTATKALILKLMLEHSKRYNCTFVMVTHENEFSKIADRVIELKDGCVVKDSNNSHDEKVKTRRKIYDLVGENHDR